MDRIFKKGQTAWLRACKSYGHDRKGVGKRAGSKSRRRFDKAIIRSVVGE
jgi:hypothetical protein